MDVNTVTQTIRQLLESGTPENVIENFLREQKVPEERISELIAKAKTKS